MGSTVRLADVADVIRSKNAGPFRLGMDILFGDKDAYERVKSAGIISKDVIANLYNIAPQDVTRIIEIDAAKAIKIAIKRPKPAGTPGDTDVYGCQQHVPLLDIEIPWE